jgi:hypothetical protein
MREIDDFGASAGATTKARCFPVEDSTTPYWRSQLHSIDQHRSTEELPAECDVAIVGSGMAGVSIAYHLTKSSKEGEMTPAIVILEARQVCSGAVRNPMGKGVPRNAWSPRGVSPGDRDTFLPISAYVQDIC